MFLGSCCHSRSLGPSTTTLLSSSVRPFHHIVNLPNSPRLDPGSLPLYNASPTGCSPYPTACVGPPSNTKLAMRLEMPRLRRPRCLRSQFVTHKKFRCCLRGQQVLVGKGTKVADMHVMSRDEHLFARGGERHHVVLVLVIPDSVYGRAFSLTVCPR